jgi:hypothetical protein
MKRNEQWRSLDNATIAGQGFQPGAGSVHYAVDAVFSFYTVFWFERAGCSSGVSKAVGGNIGWYHKGNTQAS